MTILNIIEINSTQDLLLGIAALVVVAAGIGIVGGGIARGNFGKSMTKGGIVVVGIIIIGIGALGGPALIKLGQGGAEQIGINTGQ